MHYPSRGLYIRRRVGRSVIELHSLRVVRENLPPHRPWSFSPGNCNVNACVHRVGACVRTYACLCVCVCAEKDCGLSTRSRRRSGELPSGGNVWCLIVYGGASHTPRHCRWVSLWSSRSERSDRCKRCGSAWLPCRSRLSRAKRVQRCRIAHCLHVYI